MVTKKKDEVVQNELPLGKVGTSKNKKKKKKRTMPPTSSGIKKSKPPLPTAPKPKFKKKKPPLPTAPKPKFKKKKPPLPTAPKPKFKKKKPPLPTAPKPPLPPTPQTKEAKKRQGEVKKRTEPTLKESQEKTQSKKLSIRPKQVEGKEAEFGVEDMPCRSEKVTETLIQALFKDEKGLKLKTEDGITKIFEGNKELLSVDHKKRSISFNDKKSIKKVSKLVAEMHKKLGAKKRIHIKTKNKKNAKELAKELVANGVDPSLIDMSIGGKKKKSFEDTFKSTFKEMQEKYKEKEAKEKELEAPKEEGPKKTEKEELTF